MQASHIVVLPSYREGLPLVLLEAGRSGRPVVTCDVPGCRDVVINNENGLLVPPRSASRLRDALFLLLTEPAMRIRLGQANLQRVSEHFSEDRVFPQLLQLFSSEVKAPGQF